MTYGAIKVDTIIFTENGADKNITVSGLVASTSGNLVVTGAVIAPVIQGNTTVSGATVTGNIGQFSNLTAVSGIFTNQISGSTITGNVGQFSSVSGTAGGFTTITGATVTGTTANFVTVSGTTITGNIGRFATLTGTTVTGITATFTSGIFNNISGSVCTLVSGIFAVGSATNPSISFSGDSDTGFYRPNSDEIGITTNGELRLLLDVDGQVEAGAIGSNALPIYTFKADSDTGIYSPGTNQLGITTSGIGRIFVSTTAISSTLPIAHASGSVNAPAITFSGDLNTGIYTPGGDQVAITTSGVQRINVQANGDINIDNGSAFYSAVNNRLGLGTITPGVTLHVDGDMRCDGIYGETDTDTGIIFPGSDEIRFNEGGAEAARINSSGYLLIGKTSSSGSYGLQTSTNISVNDVIVGKGSAGSSNTVCGTGLQFLSAGINDNTAVGTDALYLVTTGYSNTAVGSAALTVNSTGFANTAIGHNALPACTSSANTAVGNGALRYTTTGIYNTAVGYLALFNNTTGAVNTAVGFQALSSNQTGAACTAVGDSALLSTTASQNTAIGDLAGSTNTSGANNTFIGHNSQGVTASSSNTITLGNSSITTLRCQVTTISSLSDKRDKKNIQKLNAGLNFISELRPVSFVWNTRDGAKINIEDIGFIAQELLEAQKETGIKIPNLVNQENPDKLEAGYGTLIPILVNAVQELTEIVKKLQNEILIIKEKT
jgi:hypothetical protein